MDYNANFITLYPNADISNLGHGRQKHTIYILLLNEQKHCFGKGAVYIVRTQPGGGGSGHSLNLQGDSNKSKNLCAYYAHGSKAISKCCLTTM